LVIRFVNRALGSRTWSDLEGMLLALTMLALAITAAWTLYRFVERPTMARLAGHRRKPAAAAAQTAQAAAA
jgi:peptidoglycan/LPS O-acetylase OafA/YrhL